MNPIHDTSGERDVELNDLERLLHHHFRRIFELEELARALDALRRRERQEKLAILVACLKERNE